MKAISVGLKRIKVSSFSPAKKDVSFVVSFNDGKDKEITVNAGIDRGENVAVQIIRDIRKVENSLNAEFDGKALLDSYVSIAINDEEKVTSKLAAFISKVFEKVQVIRNQKTAEGYTQLISQVNSMRMDF
jgi:hypothetical protein